MFEQHRERRAEAARRATLAAWQSRRDGYAELIDTARTFAGTTAEGILLAPGETVFLEVSGTALVEERRGQGTYVGHSQGVSVPIARIGGRQIRYRVGATKGHYVQGTPAPTAIDSGTTYITSARVIFQGGNQTRECAFAKLIGFRHDDAGGATTFSVSNRSKPTTIHYGPACSATFDFRLDLALAHFRHTVDDLVSGLEQDLAALDAARPDGGDPGGSAHTPPADDGSAPPPPATPPSAAPGPTAPTAAAAPAAPAAPQVASVAAGWYPDPWGVAPLRWWDGTAWSWPTVDPSAPPTG